MIHPISLALRHVLSARKAQKGFEVQPLVPWKVITDIAKKRDFPLRLADRLGRGRGRVRFMDSMFRSPPPAPLNPDLHAFENSRLAIAWIGHATMLIRIGETTILTDPVFSTRVGLGMGFATVGPARFFAPAVRLKNLPKVDLILSSHAHFDHLDRPSLSRLDKNAAILCAQRTGDLIDDLGFSFSRELRWNESFSFNGLTITALPVKHWGARTILDKDRGYNAYLIESDRHSILFGGDSAYQEFFKDIGKVDVAMLGISAYDPYIAAHATPEQAWAMADHCKADIVIPMHHSTFRLSHEPMEEPITRMLDTRGYDKTRIAIKEIGGMWRL